MKEEWETADPRKRPAGLLREGGDEMARGVAGSRVYPGRQ